MLWYEILFHVMQKQQLYSSNSYWPLVFVAGVQCIILDFRNKPGKILKVLQCFNKPCSFHLQNTFSSPIFLIMRSVEPFLSHFPNHEVPGTFSSPLFLNHLVITNWIISHSSISSSYTLLPTSLTFLLKKKITLLTKTAFYAPYSQKPKLYSSNNIVLPVLLINHHLRCFSMHSVNAFVYEMHQLIAVRKFITLSCILWNVCILRFYIKICWNNYGSECMCYSSTTKEWVYKLSMWKYCHVLEVTVFRHLLRSVK